ncbi:unnamed protein product [Soboliphyme baturini]|uniref:RING-type domain-containing protein n=1 Tax=Soboliphyme baturini TaxID=241478 RepID=A0A183J920_9BILA|nr:unnamed protein product [Soboliphyme baturini]
MSQLPCALRKEVPQEERDLSGLSLEIPNTKFQCKRLKRFAKEPACPSCGNSFKGRYDILRINLNLSDQYKSMILAGQRPDVIIDICSRAISFWSFQLYQEKLYQEWLVKKARENAVKTDQQYEQTIAQLRNEVDCLLVKFRNVKEELDSALKRNEDLADKYNEKVRRCLQLHNSYEMLKRKVSTPSFCSIAAKTAKGSTAEFKILQPAMPISSALEEPTFSSRVQDGDEMSSPFIDSQLQVLREDLASLDESPPQCCSKLKTATKDDFVLRADGIMKRRHRNRNTRGAVDSSKSFFT